MSISKPGSCTKQCSAVTLTEPKHLKVTEFREKFAGRCTALSTIETWSEVSGYFSDINTTAKCSYSFSKYNQIQINTKPFLLIPRQRNYKQVRRETFLPSYWVHLQGKPFSPIHLSRLSGQAGTLQSSCPVYRAKGRLSSKTEKGFNNQLQNASTK